MRLLLGVAILGLCGCDLFDRDDAEVPARVEPKPAQQMAAKGETKVATALAPAAAPSPPEQAAPESDADVLVEGEFIRFDRAGSPNASSRVAFKVENRGTRPVGAVRFQVTYFTDANEVVPVRTPHGDKLCDLSSLVGFESATARTVDEQLQARTIAPQSEAEVLIRPNFGPIPGQAVRAELRFTEVCELIEQRGGLGRGECWWSQPGVRGECTP